MIDMMCYRRDGSFVVILGLLPEDLDNIQRKGVILVRRLTRPPGRKEILTPIVIGLISQETMDWCGVKGFSNRMIRGFPDDELFMPLILEPTAGQRLLTGMSMVYDCETLFHGQPPIGWGTIESLQIRAGYTEDEIIAAINAVESHDLRG